jgi:hypothetical protein
VRAAREEPKESSLHLKTGGDKYRLITVKGHLNVYIGPKVIERFRNEIRKRTRHTAGVSLPVMMARLNANLRGWGEYFKRAQASGVLERLDQWIARRVRAYSANALAQYLLATLPGSIPLRPTWACSALCAKKELST